MATKFPFFKAVRLISFLTWCLPCTGLTQDPEKAPLADDVGNKAATTLPAPETPRFEKPFLWRLTQKDAKSNYAFGSIHIPSDLLAPLPKSVIDAFEEADVVLTEIPFDEETMKRTADAAQSAKTPLSKRLPADLYSRFSEKLRHLAPTVDPALLDPMEAWCVAIQLVTLEQPSANPPMDFVFYQQALNVGKQAGGLESTEEALQSMFLSEEDQVAFFKATLDGMDAAASLGQTTAGQMIHAYLSGALDLLGKQLNQAQEGLTPNLRQHFGETLLNARSNKMAARMESRMKEAPEKCHFFVLGAMHFLGEGNILQRLQKAGVSVERVP